MSEKATHTKGPWSFYRDNYRGDVHPHGIFADDAPSGKRHPACADTVENACLIAAAPDLLKELEHLVRLMEPVERDGGLNIPGLATLNSARAAIAKARAV